MDRLLRASLLTAPGFMLGCGVVRMAAGSDGLLFAPGLITGVQR
ncbi:hypothetical protein [Actinomadura rudentiformis]|nr:hypothetical protein [Actinomadura rudentiformis]